VVHRLDAELLRTGAGPQVRRKGLARLVFRPRKKPRAVGVEPDMLVDDEFDLRQYGVAAKVIWTPGIVAARYPS